MVTPFTTKILSSHYSNSIKKFAWKVSACWKFRKAVLFHSDFSQEALSCFVLSVLCRKCGHISQRCSLPSTLFWLCCDTKRTGSMIHYLWTNCVFSCFSLLFRSPLVRLSFSNSVTFFSRYVTWKRRKWRRRTKRLNLSLHSPSLFLMNILLW